MLALFCGPPSPAASPLLLITWGRAQPGTRLRAFTMADPKGCHCVQFGMLPRKPPDARRLGIQRLCTGADSDAQELDQVHWHSFRRTWDLVAR